MRKKGESRVIGKKAKATEERIIQAAMCIFSRYPVNIATLRMIAEEAEMPHSLVTYYFKDKGNLYRIALDRVMTIHKESHEPFFPLLDEQAELTEKEAKKTIVKVIHGMVDRMYDPNFEAYQRILHFEMAYPSRYYEYMYEKHIKKCFELAVYLFGRATGIEDKRKLYFYAVTSLGEIASFMQERELLKRSLGLTDFTAEDAATIKEHVTRNILATLGLR